MNDSELIYSIAHKVFLSNEYLASYTLKSVVVHFFDFNFKILGLSDVSWAKIMYNNDYDSK